MDERVIEFREQLIPGYEIRQYFDPSRYAFLLDIKWAYIQLRCAQKAFWQLKYVSTDLGWFATIIDAREFIFTSMIFGSNFSPAGLENGIKLVLQRAHSLELGVKSRWTGFKF